MITQQPFYTPLTPTRHAKLTWIKQTENQSEKNVIVMVRCEWGINFNEAIASFYTLWLTTAMGQLDF